MHQEILDVSADRAVVPEGYLVAPYVAATVHHATRARRALDIGLGLQSRRSFKICGVVIGLGPTTKSLSIPDHEGGRDQKVNVSVEETPMSSPLPKVTIKVLVT